MFTSDKESKRVHHIPKSCISLSRDATNVYALCIATSPFVCIYVRMIRQCTYTVQYKTKAHICIRYT